MNCLTMLGVSDVEKSSQWFQDLFGWKSNHGGPHFESLVDQENNEKLLLHHLDKQSNLLGNGVTIYVDVGDLKSFFSKAKELGAQIVAEPHFNELSHINECTIRDKHGYLFTARQN